MGTFPVIVGGTKNLSSRGLILPLVLSLVLSCSAHSATTFPYATVEYNCAPNDALALYFYFTAEKADCQKRSEPYIMIGLWAGLPKSGPRDYSISYGDTNAVASRCLEKNKCTTANSGTLHIEKFSDNEPVTGSYILHFPDGSSEKGSFTASWCHPHFLCG